MKRVLAISAAAAALVLVGRCRRCRRARPTCRAPRAASSRRTTSGTWTSGSCPIHPKSATWKRATARGLDPAAPGLRPALLRDPVRRRAVVAREGLDRLPLRRRERPRSLPVRRRRADRGRLRPARDHDRRGDLRPLRALRASGATAATRPRAAARSSTWTRTPSAPPGGRAPTRPACRSSRASSATTRSSVPNAGIHHALRFTVGCTRRSYVWPARHQAGVADPGLPTDGRAVPAPRRFRHERVLRAGADRAPSDEALRDDRGRQRERLVLPGSRGSAVDLLVRRSAQAGARAARSSRSTRPPARCRSTPAAFDYGPGCPAP